VVIPISWVRCHLLNFDTLPRKRVEVEEVLRWRLKKLLPVSAGELKLSWSVFSGKGSGKSLLCSTGIARVLAALEANFDAIGAPPGLMTPMLYSLAMAIGSQPHPRLLVQQESGYLSMLMVESGVPKLLRTKPMPSSDPEWRGAGGEFHLVHKYIRGQLGVKEPLRVSIVSSSKEIESSLRAWWDGVDGVQLDQNEHSWSQPGVEEKLGAARMAAVNAVMGGVPA